MSILASQEENTGCVCCCRQVASVEKGSPQARLRTLSDQLHLRVAQVQFSMHSIHVLFQTKTHLCASLLTVKCATLDQSTWTAAVLTASWLVFPAFVYVISVASL